MSPDLLPAIACSIVAGIVLLGPVVFLGLGALSLRKRNYDRADTLSTLAGVGSWILLALEGLFVLLLVSKGATLSGFDPLAGAIASYPPLTWFFARTLRRSVARRRKEDSAARRFLREESREKAQDEERRRGGEPPAA
jgi:hypothetical protein